MLGTIAFILFGMQDAFSTTTKSTLAYSIENYGNYRQTAYNRKLCSDMEYNYFDGLMPEDVRYAKIRCSIDLPRANLNWWTENFNSKVEEHETYCYVKCFLRRLGLLRLDTLGWDLDRFRSLYWNLQGTRTLPINCFVALTDASEMSGECKPHYNVWITLFKEYPLVFKYFFYYNVRPQELPFITPLPPFREVGVEPLHFCAVLLPKNTIDVRSGAYMFCVYMQLHYFDGYGRIDQAEIKYSFKKSGKLTILNAKVIESCVHFANSFFVLNGKGMANRLTTCMSENIPNVFFNVLKYWNQVVSEY